MTSRTARRRQAASDEARVWRARHDALLTLVNAILLAYGNGPEKRMAIASEFYVGQPRRNVAVLPFGATRVVAYLEPLPDDAYPAPSPEGGSSDATKDD